jgi:hypothetical protein
MRVRREWFNLWRLECAFLEKCFKSIMSAVDLFLVLYRFRYNIYAFSRYTGAAKCAVLHWPKYKSHLIFLHSFVGVKFWPHVWRKCSANWGNSGCLNQKQSHDVISCTRNICGRATQYRRYERIAIIERWCESRAGAESIRDGLAERKMDFSTSRAPDVKGHFSASPWENVQLAD